jgi:hypothetical protein
MTNEIPELPNEDNFEEPTLEDLPAQEPMGEWQDSAEVEPSDDEEDESS